MDPRPVYLIGPRGCGKSSAGAEAAALLDLPFYDCDSMFKRKNGVSIAAYINSDGWVAFRRLEAQFLRNLRPGPGIVATGGGIVLVKDNCDMMRERGLVLYLSASKEILRRRLEEDPKPDQRPPFSYAASGAAPDFIPGMGPDEEGFEVSFEARLPLYLSAAHHVIDASRPLKDVAADIVALAIACGAASGQSDASGQGAPS